ncbi:LLM class flavin-dependent oxidoreductase [Paenibacillus jiagnxiensis]|uniref:LLM class flavin-dependent oxidoreductase n=1 Tax=Paenibacillus jiagnxiensis TaxID=3228926 RepID=UPI0033AE353E
MKVSVLDQTVLRDQESPEEAFLQTVETAVHADSLGYERYWVSEHHSTDALGGSSPEVLISFLAARTRRIRVGSGGVMLPHYSPYKVAENFRVLGALAPGRIDLGVGRAPGGVPLSTKALQDLQLRDPDTFSDQLRQLQEYLKDILPVKHPLHGLMTTPRISVKPQLWMLGTSPSSARLAGTAGLPYAFAFFSETQQQKALLSFQRYRDTFRPSDVIEQPYSMLAIRIIAADTDEEAEEAAVGSLRFSLMLNKGRIVRLADPQSARAALENLSAGELEELERIRSIYVIGSPSTIRRKIRELQQSYRFDELMALSLIYDFQQRKRSLELLKEAVDDL